MRIILMDQIDSVGASRVVVLLRTGVLIARMKLVKHAWISSVLQLQALDAMLLCLSKMVYANAYSRRHSLAMVWT